MGQYFKPIIGGIYGGNFKSYEYFTRVEVINTKLMEHSYWNNEFCNNIAALIYNNPKRICWVGQYALPKDFEFDVPDIISVPCYEDVYKDKMDEEDVPHSDFFLDQKYLINYDSQEYIDLEEYKKKSFSRNNRIIHPLPLLTAIGNNRGFGDFHDGNIGFEFVGKWAWQLIIILDKIPKNVNKVDIVFHEIK